MSAAKRSGQRVGVDIGGTFTDAVRLDERGRVAIAKVRTTPSDYARGFVDSLEAVGAVEEASHQSYLAHGSTVATNALVTGNVARVGLITTAGFRDVLEIGTQQRAELYDLITPKTPPLVPRERRLEVRERIGPHGQVERPLETSDVIEAAARLAEQDVDAVAVCLLFSFLNSAHEEQVGRILAERLPGIPISLSSRVAPEIREYFRTSTTVVNASLVPVISSYLATLRERLADAGLDLEPYIMRSNGGVSTADVASQQPATLIASGPAAGVIGAAKIAAAAGYPDVLTFDMGGTTADVSLVEAGEPSRRYRGDVGGHPVNLPQVDVLSIGAGGGSIATVDRFGALRVGPESAGSDPGPVGYGRGGERPTVTDAHIVLGTLPERRFASGTLTLDRDAAAAALQRHVAEPLELSITEAAEAVIRVANATMARGLRLISVERGHDPRQLALFAFGGAGPMHAAMLADELGVTRVVIPRYPGVTSAMGLLLSDARQDVGRTWVRPLDAVDEQELAELLTQLRAEGWDSLQSAGFDDDELDFRLEADMRYRGQAYELTVGLNGLAASDAIALAASSFHEAHERAYGHTSPEKDVEIVALRLRAIGIIGADPAGKGSEREAPGNGAGPGLRLENGYLLLDREALRNPVEGPALIAQDDTTVVVPEGWRARRADGEVCVLEKVSDGRR